MNKVILLCFMLLTGYLLANLSSAWGFPANYTMAYNMKVNSWRYAQSYDSGANVIYGNPEPWVLVNLPAGMGNPMTFKVQGFDSSGQFQGGVTFYPVTNSTILIYNHTKLGAAWNTVSIFYSPSSWTTSWDLLNLTEITTGQTIQTHMNYFTGLPMNFTLTPANLPGTGDSVLLISNSLLGENFHVLSSPDFWTKYTLTHIGSSYDLSGQGIIGTSNVINGYAMSDTANMIFGTNGFEAYFSNIEPSSNALIAYYAGNQIIGGGMYANRYEGSMYNLAGASNSIYSTFLGGGVPTFSIKTENAITAMFIPAFTQDYTLSAPIVNANQTPANALCFQYRIPVNGVTWDSNFTTYAYPGHLGSPYSINFLNDGYLKLTLPHKPEMGYGGTFCNDVYLWATNSNNTLDYGQIPYTRISCNSTALVMIVSNRTVKGSQFSSFYAYYGQPSTAWVDFSNTMVKNDWNIGNGNYLIIPNTQTPYLISLKYPLYVNSSSVISPYPSLDWILSVTYINGYYTDIISGNFGSIPDLTRNANTKLLIDGYNYNSLMRIYTTTLTAMTSIAGYLDSNTTNTIIGSGYYLSSNVMINIFENTANVTKLYSTQYNHTLAYRPPELAPQGNLNCHWQPSPGTGNLSNNYTNPGGGSHSIWNQTTTIYPVNTTATQQLVPWFVFSLPKFIIGIIGICGLILFASMMDEKDDLPAIFGLVLLFFIGIFAFGWDFLILGMAMSVIFIVYEYNEGKKHG